MFFLAFLAVAVILLVAGFAVAMFSFASKARDLDFRLSILERERRETAVSRAQAAALPTRVTITAPDSTQAPPSAPAQEPVALGSPAPPAPTPASSDVTRPSDPESRIPSPVPEPDPLPALESKPGLRPPSRTRDEWEALIGGKLLNRIGALALVIGVGFFLKHAIDNAWINEVTRVLMGAVAGTGCLAGAERARTRGYQIFSQGLVGAGLAILYLSVYASFNFYSLVSLPVAFALMGTVTVIAFLEAFRNDSPAVSLLAIAGGLLTPVLLSTPEPNETGLFAYLLALNLGVVIVLLRKPSWAALEPLALTGTYVLYFLWFNAFYTSEHTAPPLVFLALLWTLYHGLDLFRVAARRPLLQDFHRLIAWFHAVAAFGALYGVCIPHGDSLTALAAAVAALLYLASALVVMRLAPGSGGALVHYTVAVSTFLAWAIALKFDRFEIVWLWTIEAVGLVWLGTRHARRHIWVTGLVLLGVTTLTLLGLDDSLVPASVENFRLLLNERALAFIMVAAGAGVSAILIRKAMRPASAVVIDVLHYAWTFLLLVLLAVETNDLFRSWMIGASNHHAASLGFSRLMVLSAVLALYGLVLVRVARHVDIGPVRITGIAALFLAACLAGIRGIAFDALADFTPMLNIRSFAIIVVVAATLLAARVMRDGLERTSWIPEVRETLMILGVVLLLVLCTGEVRDVFEQQISIAAGAGIEEAIEAAARSGTAGEVERLENLKQLSLSGAWLLFSIIVMAVGLWRRIRILRLTAMILFAVTILKIFIYDLSFLDTLYRIFSFVGLGLILLAVSYLYQRYRAIILGPSEHESR